MSIVQFNYKNSKGLHAIKRDQVYFLSAFNDEKVNHGDVCEIEITSNICTSKRNGVWYDVFWVNVKKVLITEKESRKRHRQMIELEQSYGAHCPRHIQIYEQDFVSGLISFEEFEEILNKKARGRLHE